MGKTDNDGVALTEYERAVIDAVESLTRHLGSSDAKPEERETAMLFTMVKDGRAKACWGGESWQLSLGLCTLMRDEPQLRAVIMGALFAFVETGCMSRDSLILSLDRYLAVSGLASAASNDHAAGSSLSDGDSSASKKIMS